MNTIIEVTLKNDSDLKNPVTWSVILNRDELAQVVATKGLDAGNKALDGFVNTFISQFKEKIGAFINR